MSEVTTPMLRLEDVEENRCGQCHYNVANWKDTWSKLAPICHICLFNNDVKHYGKPLFDPTTPQPWLDYLDGLGEVWAKSTVRDIEVSNQGRVRNINTDCIYATNWNGWKDRALVKSTTVAEGNRSFYVHRLVAGAFLPDYDTVRVVDFLDGNEKNLKANNLQMGDRFKRRAHVQEDY